MGVLWDFLGSRGMSWGLLELYWAPLVSQNYPERSQSGGPSDISEIVTTPEQELYSRRFMKLSWALVGLSWARIGALLISLGAIERIYLLKNNTFQIFFMESRIRNTE